ncbi:hypothetical protein BaRGS_00028073, partial [Batillaria attramentaria]
DNSLIALRIAFFSTAERQALYAHGARNEQAQHAACIEIQRVWRGYNVRLQLKGLIGTTQRKNKKAYIGLRTAYSAYIQKCLANHTRTKDIMSFSSYCAWRIQQYWFAQCPERKEKHEERLKNLVPAIRNRAASVIQRAWRSHVDWEVYKYYREHITWHNQGDPAGMLRCINPQEAKLLDAASGTVVRFRLAGAKFPPDIYYKIFTHRPIQDLCANSPKDYVIEDARKAILKKKRWFTKYMEVPDVIKEFEKQFWYQRIENNGWRLASTHIVKHVLRDEVTCETTQKKLYEFSHSRLRRRQDVERQRKQKKLDWLKKMYKEGKLSAKSPDRTMATMIGEAAVGLANTARYVDPDVVEDWEVEALLKWTTGLNFDDYIGNWTTLGTTMPSDFRQG